MMIKNNVIKRTILILAIIVMTSNFIMPNYVYADESFGEKLVGGFFHLLTYLGDTVIAAIQKVMIGDSYIGSETTMHSIKYSPGMIFANKVPSLDINFLTQWNKLHIGKVDLEFNLLKYQYIFNKR